MAKRATSVARPSTAELSTYQHLTRALVGMALSSLDGARPPVTLAQFRLMLVLEELGSTPSSHAAAVLGVGASTVTRSADKLTAAGYLRRGEDPNSRRIVLLELTEHGRGLVGSVLEWRQAELSRVLARLSTEDRGTALEGVGCFLDAIAASQDQQTR